MKLKVFILAALLAFALTSCTENYRAKKLGGNMTVNLPPGKKLINATWKDNDVWYLVEDMEEGYTPKTKQLIENSQYGLINGKITFVESK